MKFQHYITLFTLLVCLVNAIANENPEKGAVRLLKSKYKSKSKSSYMPKSKSKSYSSKSKSYSKSKSKSSYMPKSKSYSSGYYYSATDYYYDGSASSYY